MSQGAGLAFLVSLAGLLHARSLQCGRLTGRLPRSLSPLETNAEPEALRLYFPCDLAANPSGNILFYSLGLGRIVLSERDATR